MLKPAQTSVQKRTEKQSSFWLALTAALILHGIILLVPMTQHTPTVERSPAQIELQLTNVFIKTMDLPTPKPEPMPEMLPEQESKPAVPKQVTETRQPPEPPLLTPAPPKREHDLQKMTPEQKARLASSILATQFISQESEADKIFGKPIAPHSTEPKKEFHFPARPNMMTMLDRPMSELPFSYTPGLIYFAYDPGVKGDLQRFWDVITPEFGWRTKNGTQFKCRWILVIAACGWK